MLSLPIPFEVEEYIERRRCRQRAKPVRGLEQEAARSSACGSRVPRTGVSPVHAAARELRRCRDSVCVRRAMASGRGLRASSRPRRRVHSDAPSGSRHARDVVVLGPPLTRRPNTSCRCRSARLARGTARQPRPKRTAASAISASKFPPNEAGSTRGTHQSGSTRARSSSSGTTTRSSVGGAS